MSVDLPPTEMHVQYHPLPQKSMYYSSATFTELESHLFTKSLSYNFVLSTFFFKTITSYGKGFVHTQSANLGFFYLAIQAKNLKSTKLHQ